MKSLPAQNMVRGVNMQGTVLGIHRMALDDGLGIRTAIFLKGCKLHCPWCHNPESQSGLPELMVRIDKCKSCGKCIHVCPVDNLSEMAKGFKRNKCLACFSCAKVCPNEAFSVAGKRMTAEEVMDVAALDYNHYQFTGGGITLTGGDPLCQAEFAFEILSKAKQMGIHTCIETSGTGQQNALQKLLPVTDLWLFDLKGNAYIYRQLVGADFVSVEQGLRYLLEQKARVILRCPIITGITDHDDWIDEICRSVNKWNKIYPIQDIHLLPFHRLGLDKYKALGKKAVMEEKYPPDEKKMIQWNEKVKQMLEQRKDG